MSKITITTIEAAINYWRIASPSDDASLALCPEARTLASIYALMIFNRKHEIDETELSEDQKAALSKYTSSQAISST